MSADGMKVGGLYAEIEVNLDPLTQGIASADATVKRAGAAMVSDLSKIETQTKKTTAAVGDLAEVTVREAQAQDKASAARERATAATGRSAAARQKMLDVGVREQRILDAASASNGRFAATTDRIAEAQAGAARATSAAAAAQEKYLGAFDRAAKAQAAAAQGAQRGAVANDNLGKSTQIAAHHVNNLVQQVLDVGVSLQAGQSPFTVLVQQGAQIGPVLGETGVMGAIKGVGQYIGRFITPATATFGALTGAVVYGYSAWSRYDDEQRKVATTLDGLGRRVGITRQQFNELAESAAAAGKISVRQATDIATALAATGRLDAPNIRGITALSKDFAATFGIDLDAAKKQLVETFSDFSGIDRLNDKLRFLDANTRVAVRSLFDQQRAQEAVRLTIEKLPDALAKSERAQGVVKKLWDAIAQSASNADRAMGEAIDSAFKPTEGADRIAQLKVQLEEAKRIRDDLATRTIVPRQMPNARDYLIPSVSEMPSFRTTNVQDFRGLDPDAVKRSTDAVAGLEKQLGEAMRSQAKLRMEEERAAESKALRQSLVDKSNQLHLLMNEVGAGSDAWTRYRDLLEAARTALQSGDPALMSMVDKVGNLSEATGVLEHVTKSLTNADGTRMTQAQQAERQRQADIAGVRAHTTAQRADAAQLEASNQVRGRHITTEQAAAEVAHRANMIREEEARQLRDTLLGQQLEAREIQKRIDLLGLDEESRAVVIARQKAENELTRQGTDLRGELAQQIIAGAEANARLSASYDKAVEAQQRMRDGQRELTSEFASFADEFLLGAGRIDDAFRNLTRTFASGSLRALLTGEGGLAGLYGTAGDRGQPGGVLGSFMTGKASLSNLFDFDKLTKSVTEGTSTGAEQGTQTGLSFLMKGGSGFAGYAAAIMPVAAGGAAGLASGNPVAGGLTGGLAGLASGNPVMALAGAAAGLLGGLFGKSEAEKAREAEKKQAVEAYRQAQPQIDAMRAGFRGEATTGGEATLKAAYAQAFEAATLAQKAGDAAGAAAIMADQVAFSARLRAQFAATYAGILADLEAGRGTGGPFGAAAAAATQLGESLKGFVKDAEGAGLGIDRARSAAIKGALATIEGPEELSATATELERIRGTAAGLSQVLVDLGMSATDAAEAIQSRTSAAMKALRSTFRTDLQAQINDASGRRYLNDINDAVAARRTGLADAEALGAGTGKVETLFALSIQKIVNETGLAGGAFDGLMRRFPQLKGRVEEFSEALAKTETAADRAARAAEIAARKQGYDDRAFAARVDIDTRAGALAAFDRKAAQERAEETKRGGDAMKALERALAAERLGIIKDFARQETEAKKQAAEEQKQAAIEARDFLAGTFKSYRSFIDDLNAGSGSTLSPGDRYDAAKSQFGQQLAIAKGSDPSAAREALSSLTQYASNLLDASKAMYASGEAYQNDRLGVIDALSGLPKQVDATDLIVNAITTASKDQLSKQELIREAAALTAVNVANTKSAIEANSPGAIASALQNGFDQIDTNKNGRLSLAEFTKALGPLSTKEEQATARAIFDKIDASGNGALEKAELIRAQAAATAASTAAAAANALATKAAVDAAANSNLAGLNGVVTATGSNSPAAINNALRGNFTGLATDANLQNTVPDKINTSIKGNFNGLASDTGIGNVKSSVDNTKGAIDGTKGSIDSGNGVATTSQTVLRVIQNYANATQKNVATGNKTLSAIKTLNSTQKQTLEALNNQFSLRNPVAAPGRNLNNNMLEALNRIVYNTANTVLAIKSDGKYGDLTYASGGYTGPGGKYDVAGVVHKGEIVWSQANIARAGGVAAVEAMRLGLPGYADGGLVRALNDNFAPRIMPMPVAGGMSPGEWRAVVDAVNALRPYLEMIGRVAKQAGEKTAEAAEGTTRAVLAGASGQQRDGKAPVGKGRSALNRAA